MRFEPVGPLVRNAFSKYVRNWRSSSPWVPFPFCFSRNCTPYPTIFARRACPCCPGTKLRFSIAHFSVKHRRPFKKSFCPSRRHSRQTASRCLAKSYLLYLNLCNFPEYLSRPLYAAALGRSAAVVRHRRHVLNRVDVQSRRSQRAHCRFPSRARSLHAHFHRFHSVLVTRHARRRRSRLLCRVWRALARTLESHRACRRPAHRAAIGIGQRHDRVVERRLDAHHAVRHHALFLLLAEFLLALGAFRRCRCCRRSSRCCCRVFRFFCHARVSPVLLSRLISADLTCEPRSSSPPLRPSVVPYACARWCACAVREPASCGDAA